MIALSLQRKNYSIQHYKYGRNPHLKNHLATNPYPQENCTEYLVTLVGKHILVNNTTIVQFDDPGKASLVTNINLGEKSVLIANIHCPFGNLRNVAFNKLIGELGTNQFVIIGDLNSESWELKKMLDQKIYRLPDIFFH
jgi:hypothetical protein